MKRSDWIANNLPVKKPPTDLVSPDEFMKMSGGIEEYNRRHTRPPRDSFEASGGGGGLLLAEYNRRRDGLDLDFNF